MKLLFREHHDLGMDSYARLSVYDCGNFKLSVRIRLSNSGRRIYVTVYRMGEEYVWCEIYRGDFWDSTRTIPGRANNKYPDEVYDPIEERALERATMILDGE